MPTPAVSDPAAGPVVLDAPRRAEAMGRAGRKLCERYYNIERFGMSLHEFFEGL